MNKKHLILIILFITSGILYYNLTLEKPQTTTARITKVIDGDTIILNDTTKVRLLGINTPESNQPYYQEAKTYLTKFLNKTIQLESHGQDKYSRTLGHIFHENQNINALILQNGLATLYYYDHDSHYEKLQKAEEFARNSNIGLWKKSKNSPCISITKFQHEEPESLILQNNCNYQINITYKDDATHHYTATINPNSQYQSNFSHIWNDDGDTLYIYDNKGLILFERY